MKTIEIRQGLVAWRDFDLTITNEELFIQKYKEWIEENQYISVYSFEEEHFQDCCEIECGEIDWNDEFLVDEIEELLEEQLDLSGTE